MAESARASIASDRIRNFSIIAHIDHGKTTLTDRLLELTGNVTRGQAERVMDSNPIEKERGITIKLAPVRLTYHGFQLNLIDTPGHVDFSYEVSRSLAACEGALLVVDATQGVQAQTLSNYYKAQKLGLKIIPVINKIDLPVADVEKTTLELMDAFDFQPEDIIAVSAKSGLGVDKILDAIVAQIPPPGNSPLSGDRHLPARGSIITATFDRHRGAIAYVRLYQGQIHSRDKLVFLANSQTCNPLEIGCFTPDMTPLETLAAGEVGYICTGLKDIRQLAIGDTFTTFPADNSITPLPGFKKVQPVVFMEVYPIDADLFPELQDAVVKLSYHDAALSFSVTHSNALGSGIKVGFLGILHAEIVLERLHQEFNLDLIATAPTVDYQVTLTTGEQIHVFTPSDLPDPSQIAQIEEPIVRLEIFTPEVYGSQIIQFARTRRGELVSSEFTAGNLKIIFQLPLSELITDFHDQLKSLSSGFASLEYEQIGYQAVKAVKVNILLAGEQVEALSFIALEEQAESKGRQMVEKLKQVVPRQMFEIPVQAAIGSKVIARETIKAYRKDVTAKLYGGDVTRRQKLLKKQARGKKRMKQFGKVNLDQDVFLSLLRQNNN
ncbi:translation elongation factor 4 [bacterium]|nr:translation elongation factor 4 [bacterium]